MGLDSGARLGPYEILAVIGAGGMGEVYRARDTRLDRQVALKLLPEDVARDPDRLTRFEREARAASALNHPAIVTVYDVGSTETQRWISMELVDGQTLRDLLANGPLPVRRTLTLAAQIAEGLAKAHEAGIVHRDLKPENVMVSSDGFAKILDFGLARLTAHDAPDAATHAGDTRPGMVIGTLAYMSPEQASGSVVDFRSDQFAFGAVLYEMLTGQRAFARSSSVETLSAVLGDDPPAMGQLKPSIPLPVRWIVERCLEKQPADRYGATRDLARDLATARDHLTEMSTTAAVVVDGKRGARRIGAREIVAWSLAVFSPLAIAGVFLRSTPRSLDRTAAAVRFALPGPENWTIDGDFVVSPDGRRIALAASENERSRALWVRALDSLSWQRLQGTEGATNPFWSADGGTIAFFTPDKLKRVSADGGEVRTITDVIGEGNGATWRRDDTILFGLRTGVYRVPAAGGTPSRVAVREAQADDVDSRPLFLDNGQHYLFFRIGGERSGIYIGALDSGDVTRIKELGVRDVTFVGFTEPNFVLFVQNGTLLAQTLNPERTALVGDAIRVAENINVDPPETHFSVSRTGLLVYRVSGSDISELRWTRRDGVSSGNPIARGAFSHFSLSRDGRHLAASRLDTAPHSIWAFDLERGSNRRLTFEYYASIPVWSPDGTRVAFGSARDSPPNLYTMTIDSASQAERLTRSTFVEFPTDWSPDGQYIVFTRIDLQTGFDLWALPLAGERIAKPVLNGPYAEAEGAVSPNGRWMAYTSDESGRLEVYVTSFPNAGDRWPISTAGGSLPVWSANGRELYYRDGQKIMSVTLEPGSVFEASAPKLLFEVQGFPWEIGSDRRSYDVAPDGRFLLNVIVERTSQSLTVVTDWRAAVGR